MIIYLNASYHHMLPIWILVRVTGQIVSFLSHSLKSSKIFKMASMLNSSPLFLISFTVISSRIFIDAHDCGHLIPKKYEVGHLVTFKLLKCTIVSKIDNDCLMVLYLILKGMITQATNCWRHVS